MDDARIKEMVRAHYGEIAAASEADCCAPAASACYGPQASPEEKAREMGYSDSELAAVPEGSGDDRGPQTTPTLTLPRAGGNGRGFLSTGRQVSSDRRSYAA